MSQARDCEFLFISEHSESKILSFIGLFLIDVKNDNFVYIYNCSKLNILRDMRTFDIWQNLLRPMNCV